MKKSLNRSTANKPILYPVKILQFGGGNFLRAFVDRMIDDLNRHTDFNGSIMIIKPTSSGDYKALRAQEGLFHIWMSGYLGGEFVSRVQLVESVSQVINPYQEWHEFLKTAGDPNIRFVISNTTEAGIRYKSEPFIEDVCPGEFPAKLTRWLWKRFQCFDGSDEAGCIVIPCELITDNGDELYNILLEYSKNWQLPGAFTQWLGASCFFCNTLVDQIVPGYPKNPFDERFDQMEYNDELIATCEPYHIWVIKGSPCVRLELPFDKTECQVVFSDDVDMYRTRKIRILNGAHTSMVPVGILLGMNTVGEMVNTPETEHFIRELITKEIIPSIDLDSSMLLSYGEEVLDRFRNPTIEHQLWTIALNTIPKFRTRILPSLLHYSNTNTVFPPRLVFVFASLLWLYRGHYKGRQFLLKDDHSLIHAVQSCWPETEMDRSGWEQLVQCILQNHSLWGRDLSIVGGLSDAIVQQMEEIDYLGYAAAFNIANSHRI